MPDRDPTTIKPSDYSMSIMNISKNKANRLNYELFILSFIFANITGPSKLPHGNDETPI